MSADASSPSTPPQPPADGRRRHLRRIAVLLRVAPALGIVVAVGTWSHLPTMHLQPAIGLVAARARGR